MARTHVLSDGRGRAARKAALMLSAASALGLLLILGVPRVGACHGMFQQQHAAIMPGAPETAAQTLKKDMDKEGKVLVIDVRGPQAYAEGHVPGAINIPIEQLQNKIDEMKVPKNTTIVTVCEHGGRSSRAALELQKLGYKTSSFCRLDGWKKQGYKVETGGGKPAAAPEPH